jgi:hypothetical protein
MTLAFYKVGNSKEYERHTFDMWCDKPQVIKEMLSELKDEELRMYNMDNMYDVDFFQEDYNDEKLDGGWWCVVIND